MCFTILGCQGSIIIWDLQEITEDRKGTSKLAKS